MTSMHRTCCASCRHFNGRPLEIEAAFPGLSSLSSAYAAVRSDDGLCALHDRYVAGSSVCEGYRSDAVNDRGDSLRHVTSAPANPQGHQFQSPPSRNSAGPITIRTSVASINTATANVKPNIFTTSTFPNVKAANTTIMIAAALVIRPPVFATPSTIASTVEQPFLLASSTRATRNTS